MKPDFYSISDAALVGSYAIGLDMFNRPIPGTHLWRKDVLEQTLYPEQRPNVCRRYDGVTVSLVNIWSRNYFHWLLENLVQLIYLDPNGINRILIPSKPPAYITSSLDALRLMNLAVEWDGIPTIVDELCGFGPVRVDGHNYVDGLYRLRDTFMRVPFSVSRGRQYEEIYISRRNANSRRILNEPALFRHLLDRLHGIIVLAENLEFQEQVGTFGGAKIILSSHGSGLVNMIWTKEKCKIIEVFGSYHNPCYEKLAQDLGHEYHRVDGTPVDDNILAPLDILEELL